MWLTAIPVIGDIVKKGLEIALKRWGVNKTDQEIQKMAQEITADANIKDMIQGFWDFLIAYEGKPDLFVQLGWVGKILAFLRMGWRPVLQWGMTVDVLVNRFVQGIPIMDMKEEIVFIGSLAVLREIGKKFSTKNGGE